jgi:hypothetical protein
MQEMCTQMTIVPVVQEFPTAEMDLLLLATPSETSRISQDPNPYLPILTRPKLHKTTEIIECPRMPHNA